MQPPTSRAKARSSRVCCDVTAELPPTTQSVGRHPGTGATGSRGGVTQRPEHRWQRPLAATFSHCTCPGWSQASDPAERQPLRPSQQAPATRERNCTPQEHPASGGCTSRRSPETGHSARGQPRGRTAEGPGTPAPPLPTHGSFDAARRPGTAQHPVACGKRGAADPPPCRSSARGPFLSRGPGSCGQPQPPGRRAGAVARP